MVPKIRNGSSYLGTNVSEAEAKPANADSRLTYAEIGDRYEGDERTVRGKKLIDLIDSGRLNAAMEMCRMDINAEARDESGRTPLMASLAKDYLPVVKQLVLKGADPYSIDIHECTSYFYAHSLGAVGWLRISCRFRAIPRMPLYLSHIDLAAFDIARLMDATKKKSGRDLSEAKRK